MSAYIELEDWVNIVSVENAHRRACQEQEKPYSQFGAIGWRAARARDPKLLKVLEIASNLMVQLEEDQRKETMRTSQIFAEQRMTTETQLWIEAYKTVDENRPIINLMWIYGAAAKLAGFQL